MGASQFEVVSLGLSPDNVHADFSGSIPVLNSQREVFGGGRDFSDDSYYLTVFLPKPAYGLPAGISRLPFPPAGDRILQVIVDGANNQGEVIGYVNVEFSEPISRTYWGFRWSGGEFTYTGRTLPISINDSGAMVVHEFDDQGVIQPVYQDDTNRVAIPNPFGSPTPPDAGGAFAISGLSARLNNRGEVLLNSVKATRDFVSGRGWTPWTYEYRVDIWRDGTLTQLPAGNAYDVFGGTAGSDLNDRGEVVGRAPNLVWLYLPEPAYGLSKGVHTIWQSQFSVIRPRMNNLGQVLLNPDGIDDSALLYWERGQILDVRDGLPPDFDGSLRQLLALNDQGEFLAGGTEGGASQMFLLSPVPQVTLTLDLPQSRFEIGDDFDATITVRSTKKDPQTIAFNGPLLSVSAAGVLNLPRVEPPDPFVLTTNDPARTFTVPIVATNSGVTELSSLISVTNSGGDMTNLTARQQVIVSPLQVSLRAKPLINGKPIVNMTLDDSTNSDGSTNAVRQVRDGEGNVISPAIEVTVTNVTDQPAVALVQGIDPVARDSSAVLGRIKVQGDFPQDLGTLPAHGQVSVEYPLAIANDGRFEFSALVTGAFPDAPGATLVATRKGAPIAVGEPYPMELELELSDPFHEARDWGHGTIAVAPGASVWVLGTVHNRTSNGTLKFTGIQATFERNAFGGILTTVEGSLNSPPMAPLSVTNKVDAEGAVTLAGTILTATNGPPAGTVTWILPDDAKLVDDQTGDETDVTPEDILVQTKFGGWGGDDLTVRIVQDNSRPVLPPQTYWQEVTHYSHGAMLGIGDFAYTSFDALGALGRVAGRAAGDPTYLANVYGDVTRSVWNAAELMANTWRNMSDADRQAFVKRVAAEVLRRALLLAATERPFDANDTAQALQFTQNAVYPLFNGIEQAYASGDPAQIEELQGKIGSNLALQVATSFVPLPEFTQFSKASELIELAENADNVRNAANAQEILLRNMVDGPVTTEIAEKAWGAGGDELMMTQKILKALGMKGYMRERSPRAVELINQLAEAIWKPEAMKPKSINDLDLLILGDHAPRLPGKAPGTTLDPEGVVAIFRPEDDAVIRARLEQAGETPEVIEAALARAEARREEYQKYLPKFKQWSEEGLPVEFNYKDNAGVPIDPEAPPGAPRQFEFATFSEEGGPVIHVPKMANSEGALRYITGDVDWVHFSWLDGTPLSPEVAGKLYGLLSRYAGLQHGDTISWIKEGQIIFKAKANQLIDYVTGEKALLEVTGDSLRAVRIKPELTRFAADGRSHLIFFDEGTKSLQAALSQAKLETAFADVTRVLRAVKPRPILLPFLWIQSANGTNSSIGDNNQWTYNDSPDAILARRNGSGEIQRFDGENWVPWTPPAPGNSIQLTPTTSLDSDVSAGTTEIPITPLDQLWADELTGHLDAWFKAGDTVVIAPGQPSEEVRKVASLGSLVLDRPLQYSHPAGTLVAVVPANLSITETPATAPVRILSMMVDQSSGTATIIWSSTAQQIYTLEESDDLTAGSWSPVGGTIGGTVLADGSTTSVSIPLDADGPSHFYRVRIGTP